MVSEQQCCQNLDFSYILLENFAKTMGAPQKTKVLVPKCWRVPTKTKKQQQQKQSFGGYPKLWFFWDPSRSWEHFGSGPRRIWCFSSPCQVQGDSLRMASISLVQDQTARSGLEKTKTLAFKVGDTTIEALLPRPSDSSTPMV